MFALIAAKGTMLERLAGAGLMPAVLRVINGWHGCHVSVGMTSEMILGLILAVKAELLLN